MKKTIVFTLFAFFITFANAQYRFDNGKSIARADTIKNRADSTILIGNFRLQGTIKGIVETDPVYNAEKSQYLTTETDPTVKAINGLVKSDGSIISAATSEDYLNPYSANFKDRIKYNGDSVFYLPTQGASFFEGSMFVGNGGKNLSHVTGSQGQRNTSFGKLALHKVSTGNSNSAYGYASMQELTTGANNSAYGWESLKINTTGNSNSAFGIRSLYVNTTGSSNTALGQASLGANTTGSQNVAIGISSGLNGNYNNSVLIGYRSGYGTTGKGLNQNGVIKMGYLSGQNDTINDRLFIENSNSQTPLVGGKFDSDQLGVNMLITTAWKATFNIGGSLYTSGAHYQDLLTGSLTDGTPTAAQINTITGLTPATATAGYKRQILDSDGTGLIYDITSDGTNWQYLVRTKAL